MRIRTVKRPCFLVALCFWHDPFVPFRSRRNTRHLTRHIAAIHDTWCVKCLSPHCLALCVTPSTSTSLCVWKPRRQRHLITTTNRSGCHRRTTFAVVTLSHEHI